MDIHSLTNASDYKLALARLESLIASEAGTVEGEELDSLATLIDDYEAIHFPIDTPNTSAGAT